MIVVDASALVAIVEGEPEAVAFAGCLSANESVISSINYVEAGIILIGRQRMRHRPDYDLWLDRVGVTVEATADLASPALAAYLIYGRGYHRARLNLADCFAYALAKQLDAPLLYKGDDFKFTDVRPALQPT